jgi:CDP-6-deoxy-D-xylo-4-hexulose-3-dehydrase
LGHAIRPSELSTFAKKNDLILINDVCESLGSWSEGIHAGTEGIAGSFSFYFSHHITTMEGGGISTDSDSFADDLRSMRSHGWSRDRTDVADWTVNKSTNDSKFLFVSTGYNVRPMEIQAAVGSLQIDSIEDFVAKRREIATRVSMSLEDSNLEVIGKETLDSDPRAHSWMLIPIRVTGENSAKKLERLEIETRPVLTGNFLAQPAIQRITRHAVDPLKFENATQITNEAFMVGAHHDLTEDQINFLCESLSEVGKL